jgi:hypothetical protein
LAGARCEHLLLLLLLVPDADAVSSDWQALCLPVGTDCGHGAVREADVALLGTRAEVRSCRDHDAFQDLGSSLQRQ